MKTIKLSLEYACSPLWLIDGDGDLDTVEPDDLPLSHDLKKNIILWNNVYHAAFDEEYPPDSGFSSKEANKLLQEAFRLEGKELYLRLKSELNGKYKVKSKFNTLKKGEVV